MHLYMGVFQNSLTLFNGKPLDLGGGSNFETREVTGGGTSIVCDKFFSRCEGVVLNYHHLSDE